MFVQFEDNLCDEVSCGLVEFSLVMYAFGCFRVLKPKFTICLLPMLPFLHANSKRIMSNFDAIIYKLAENPVGLIDRPHPCT